MYYFEKEKCNIKKCNENSKELKDCKKTLKLYFKESNKNNPYIKLAEDFCKYNNYSDTELDELENNTKENIENLLFYKYLRKNCKHDKYVFPLKNNEKIEAKINIFKPYQKVICEGSNEEKYVIDPKWHLIVSNYAFFDVVNNHENDCNICKDSINKTTRFTNNVLTQWLNEIDEKK